MSFSSTAKNELARTVSQKSCCNRAEFTAFLRMEGNVHIGTEHKISISMTTKNAAAARKMVKLAKELFSVETEIVVFRNDRLKKQQMFTVRIPPQNGVMAILSCLGIGEEGENIEGATEKLLHNKCCQRAYLRGAFLGGGSVSNPENDYHLEIVSSDLAHCKLLIDLMGNFGLQGKLGNRKNGHVVYLKESEQIADFLNIIGAHQALLALENTRVYKGMRNQVNRLVNCETANLNKTVNAAIRQQEEIKFIIEKLGWEGLDYPLRELAQLRLEHPDISFKELGAMLSPPIGKSGVNHRMKKIEEIAADLRGNSE